MEIKQYLLLLRKWAWLLILGGVLGGMGAYFFSARQPEVYLTSSRVMVSRSPDEQTGSYYSVYNDLQLAKTYSQLIAAQPVLQATSQKLGFPVYGGQITVKQVPDSLLLDVTVMDSNPERAALIANSLIAVFIDYNESLQKSRFAASEESLQTQISQIEGQINSLQDEMTTLTEESEATLKLQQEEQIQQRLVELKDQLDQTEEEIIKVEGELEAFFPVPALTSTPYSPWSATATPVPTPTLSPVKLVEYKETQNRLDQHQTLRDLYNETYASLLVLGETGQASTYNRNNISRQSQLQATFALYQQIYTNLLNNYESVRLARLRSTPNVVQIEPAPVPRFPIQPQPLRNALMGTVAGVLIMGAIAFMIEYLDDTLKTPEDINQHLHLPVIGLIGEIEKPKKKDNSPGVYVADNPLSPITEAFRTLRTNLEFASVDKPLRTLLITSVGPSEGKSTVAVNLASIMAQGEKTVILVDTDLRRPTVHRYLRIPNRRGLSDLFRNSMQLSSVVNTWGNPGFTVLTSGGLPPNPTELLASVKMALLLDELKALSDMVILDTSPAIIADPMVMAAKVDGVLVVIEPGNTRIGPAQVLMEQLQRAGARVVGVVLNPISRKRLHYYSKYSYYSAYYYDSGAYGYVNGGNGSSNRKKRGLLRKKDQDELKAPSE